MVFAGRVTLDVGSVDGAYDMIAAGLAHCPLDTATAWPAAFRHFCTTDGMATLEFLESGYVACPNAIRGAASTRNASAATGKALMMVSSCTR